MSDLLTYADVPKERMPNLLWRLFCWKKLREGGAWKKLIIESCKADCLFYINSFVWTFDTRKATPCLPFNTWPFQDDLINKTVHNILESLKPENAHRRWDIGGDKTRDMGVTWCNMVIMDWLGRFRPDSEFRCISRKEEYVDNPDDMDSLFKKLDYIEERLPNTLQVRGTKHDRFHGRAKLRVAYGNRSVLKGESSNENAGRGGRNLAAFRDEEAFAENGSRITRALNQTTRCQIRWSTPNGLGNSFHVAKLKGARGEIDWITLHWTQHPEKRCGLYSVADNKVTIIDHEWHREHPGYQFVIGPCYADPGVEWEFLRSPWFDGEVMAADSAMDIAQELQVSYLGSGSPYFRPERLADARARNELKPFWEGQIHKFLKREKPFPDIDGRPNRCRHWMELQFGNLPQNRTYSFGIDISAGTGASDSVVSIGDDIECRKVFEFISNGLTPEGFGRVVLALSKFFTTEAGKPYIAWDMAGHGIPFGRSLTSHGGLHLFYHKNVDGKMSKTPGLPFAKDIKKNIFSEYRSDLDEGMFVSHSGWAYDQAEQFVHDSSGRPVHQKSKTTEDSSDVGEQHGDITTSEVILNKAMKNRPTPIKPKRVIPYGSMAWRDQEREREQHANRDMFTAEIHY